MRFKVEYGSHLPLTIRAFALTTGPVLEMGTGLFSTPVLHWLCLYHQRLLVSYESNYDVYKEMMQFGDEYHNVCFVNDYADANIEKPWGLALIDHDPCWRRRLDIARLADYAHFVIAHDAQERNERHYRYSRIYPLFRYKYIWKGYDPYWTAVLSNYEDFTPC